jgi:alpha-D-ribose 1-methylphosphonate 5-triphosphate synthase subunit PhnG
MKPNAETTAAPLSVKRLMREGDMRKASTDRKTERQSRNSDAAPTVRKCKEPAPELNTDELDRVVGGRGDEFTAADNTPTITRAMARLLTSTEGHADAPA